MINIVRKWAAVNTRARLPNNGLDRMDMALMCNLIKFRLQARCDVSAYQIKFRAWFN